MKLTHGCIIFKCWLNDTWWSFEIDLLLIYRSGSASNWGFSIHAPYGCLLLSIPLSIWSVHWADLLIEGLDVLVLFLYLFCQIFLSFWGILPFFLCFWSFVSKYSFGSSLFILTLPRSGNPCMIFAVLFARLLNLSLIYFTTLICIILGKVGSSNF